MGFLKGLTEMVTSTMSIPGAVLHDVVHAPVNLLGANQENKRTIQQAAPKTTEAAGDVLSHGTGAVADLFKGKLY